MLNLGRLNESFLKHMGRNVLNETENKEITNKFKEYNDVIK